MKIICTNKQHWEIVRGKLILGAKTDDHLAAQLSQMTARLEAEIRLEIYDKICEIDFTQNKKQIVKSGIENVALQVQDICARIALGEIK